MKLSIVIPLYNNEKQIKRCLLSLLTQELLPSEYEIIIIDDGSTDLSNLIAKSFADEYKNIHLYCQKNAGPGAARNTGLDAVRGDYVYFIDADDYIANNVLKGLIELAELNNLEILGFNIKHVDDDCTLPNTLTPNSHDISVEVMNGMECIQKHGFRTEVWWYITKRTFLIESGLRFPCDRFSEDVNFTTSLILQADRISKVNIDVYRYVSLKTSLSRNNDQKHMLKYINGLVTNIEEYNVLIEGLSRSNLLAYNEVFKKFKRKQYGWVFAIFIKVFKCRLNFKDLKKLLLKLKKLGVYPVTYKYGAIGGNKRYNKLLIAIFNNRILLYSALKISKLRNFS